MPSQHDARAQWITDWKMEWTAQQSKRSQHPAAFWDEIATLLIDGRLPLGNNPLVPVGHYAIDWAGAMDYLVTRNNRGIELEKSGDIEAAVRIYELSVADAFFGTYPYDRLRILYAKRDWYRDAMRVCETYLALPDRPQGQNKAQFKQHLEKLKARAEPHR